MNKEIWVILLIPFLIFGFVLGLYIGYNNFACSCELEIIDNMSVCMGK